jgi:hypothetical protein
MKIKSCWQQLFTQWKSLFTFTGDNFWKLDISAGHYDRHTCMQVLSTILVQKSEQVLLFLPQRS